MKCKTTEVRYREVIVIKKPWALITTRIDTDNGLLILEVGWDESAPFKCPECTKACVLIDMLPQQQWRQGVTLRLSVIIRASLPRVSCETHGIKCLTASWIEGAGAPVHKNAWSKRSSCAVDAFVRLRTRLLLSHWSQQAYSRATRLLRPIADAIRRPLVVHWLRNVGHQSGGIALPYNPDPPYRALQCVGAHPLSIVGARSDLRALLATDYINLSCRRVPGAGPADVAIVPWRSIGRLAAAGYCEVFSPPMSLSFRTRSSRDIIQWMLDRLGDGWYLILHVNKYYIPGTAGHLKGDFCHDVLVVGCDTKNRTISVITYLSTGKYSVTNVPFESMAMAVTLRGVKQLCPISVCYKPAMLAVRRTDLVRFSFDLPLAINNIQEYLSSLPPQEGIYTCDDPKYAGDWVQLIGYPTKLRCYGMQAFQTTVKNFVRLVDNGAKMNMRDTLALWEHKKILLQNMSTWSEQSSALDANLTASYGTVTQWARTIHVMCHMYNQFERRNAKQLMRVLEQLPAMVAAERQILDLCYQGLIESVPSGGSGQVQPVPRHVHQGPNSETSMYEIPTAELDAIRERSTP